MQLAYPQPSVVVSSAHFTLEFKLLSSSLAEKGDDERTDSQGEVKKAQQRHFYKDLPFASTTKKGEKEACLTKFVGFLAK